VTALFDISSISSIIRDFPFPEELMEQVCLELTFLPMPCDDSLRAFPNLSLRIN
jgi:hypothetical protein